MAGLAPHLGGPHRLVLPHFAVSGGQAMRFDQPGPNLVHTGSLSLSDPDCTIAPLLCAFERALIRRPELHLHMAGRLSASERAAIAASPAVRAITVHGVLTMPDALGMQRSADGLVAVAAPGAPVPPGKLCEYYAARRPVVALGSRAWTEPAGLGDGGVEHAASMMVRIDGMEPPAWPEDLMSEDDAAAAVLSLLDR